MYKELFIKNFSDRATIEDLPSNSEDKYFKRYKITIIEKEEDNEYIFGTWDHGNVNEKALIEFHESYLNK